MILTHEQLEDTPWSYITRRFAGTLVKSQPFGVVFIHRCFDDGTVQYSVMSSMYAWEQEEVKRVSFSRLLPIESVQGEVGFLNTPQGAVQVYDMGRRQWTWGASPDRFAWSGADEMSSKLVLLGMFLPDMVYPEQLFNERAIAIGRHLRLRSDGVLGDTMGYQVARVDRATMQVTEVLSPTLWEDYEAEWNGFEWKVAV